MRTRARVWVAAAVVALLVVAGASAGVDPASAATRRARPRRPPVDLVAKARGILAAEVPSDWLAALPVDITLIPGRTNYALRGQLQLATRSLRGRNAVFLTVHEWGHEVAYQYGTQAFSGAPPTGFPYAGPHPEEVFADCVANALTGATLATGGAFPFCSPDQSAWAGGWLATGPASHPVVPRPAPAPAPAPLPPPPLEYLKVGTI